MQQKVSKILWPFASKNVTAAAVVVVDVLESWLNVQIWDWKCHLDLELASVVSKLEHVKELGIFYKYQQCDQIGRFSKVLGNKFACKSSPKHWWLFGPFWKASLNVKTAVASIWATFGNIWCQILLQYLVTPYSNQD